MTPLNKNIWLNWLLVVGFCTAIFIQSCFATPALGPTFPFKDKFMHMGAYGFLAALFYRACRLTWPDRFAPALLMMISITFATLYGVSDEIHQSFVKVRYADWGDVLADFVGSGLGAAWYFIIHQSRRGNEIRSHRKRNRHRTL
jgi:VanZ family protein